MSGVKNKPSAERFGRYLLLEPIGHGGMAEVFRAVAHGVEGFQRVFVIKRILKEKSQSKDFIEMFVAEARVSALLNHPNIVQSYDFGQINGSYFISMEYLRGKDLLTLMRQLRACQKSLDPMVAAHIAQQVAAGLHYAHSLTGPGGKPLDIVHRDVSPSNIMLLRTGGVKLLDFGIAKVGQSHRKEGADASDDTFIKGKLSYLSPEQIRGDTLDARSDVFSLGVCLWEMLTGRRLFFDKNDLTIMKNVLDRPVVPPSMQRSDVPTALDYIVVRALERDVTRRYRSAKEMADELESFLAEAQFSPSALPRVLDDLFGVDTGVYETQMEGALQSSWGELGAVEGDSVHEVSQSPLPTVMPSAPAAGSLRRSGGGRLAGFLVAMGALTLLAVVAFARGRSTAKAPEVVAASARPPQALPEPAPPVLAEATPAPPAAATPDDVDIRIDSQPPKAQVLGPAGEVLGETPTHITLPRSAISVVLTLRRKGFADVSHAVTPDRDAQVMLSLPRRGAKAPANVPPAAEALAAARGEAGAQAPPAEPAAPAPPPPAPEAPAAEPEAPAAATIEPVLPSARE